MSCSVSANYESTFVSDEELLENFLNTFQLLTPKQQKIWRVIQWYSQTYRAVFPSHSTIAKKVGCHRDTVIQTMKKFKEWGWLVSAKRCFRSCVYLVSEVLKKIDTKLNDTFRVNPTDNPTENPTLYNTYSLSCNERIPKPKENVAVQSIKDHKEQALEKVEIIQKMGIKEQKDIWCLCRYPIMALRYAYEDLITRKSNNCIVNLAAWLTSRCKANKIKLGG